MQSLGLVILHRAGAVGEHLVGGDRGQRSSEDGSRGVAMGDQSGKPMLDGCLQGAAAQSLVLWHQKGLGLALLKKGRYWPEHSLIPKPWSRLVLVRKGKMP